MASFDGAPKRTFRWKRWEETYFTYGSCAFSQEFLRSLTKFCEQTQNGDGNNMR